MLQKQPNHERQLWPSTMAVPNFAEQSPLIHLKTLDRMPENRPNLWLSWPATTVAFRAVEFIAFIGESHRTVVTEVMAWMRPKSLHECWLTALCTVNQTSTHRLRSSRCPPREVSLARRLEMLRARDDSGTLLNKP
jgi:hypothetical protein